MADEPTSVKAELDALRVENGRREEELHERGACSDRILPQLRTEAFIDSVVDALDVRDEFHLRVEQRRADAYEKINGELDKAEAAQRQQVLTGGAPLRMT